MFIAIGVAPGNGTPGTDADDDGAVRRGTPCSDVVLGIRSQQWNDEARRSSGVESNRARHGAGEEVAVPIKNRAVARNS